MHRRDFMAGALALPLLAKAGHARAESGPLTRIIFPFAAGGGGDTLCRQLAQYLPPLLDRNVIVENRTGGDGLIGIRAVKGASPDGTTILVTTGPTMYLLPMVETEPSFDTAKDFVPVSQLARFEFAIVVEPVDRREGFHAARGVAQGQSREGDLRRAEQRHHSAFHRLAARADAQALDDARALSRLGADRQRPDRRTSAVRHHHACGRDHAASRRQRYASSR